MYLNGEAHIDLRDWLGTFAKNNICNEFIEFFISNSYNFENLIKNNEFDDDKIVNILNIINGII